MKKSVFTMISVCLLFSLTSCRVNWFDRHYDVPWWVVAVPTVIICAIIFFIAGKIITSKKYVCSKCKQAFYPKWRQAVISVHINSDRFFKCPHCGQRSFCKPYDEKEK